MLGVIFAAVAVVLLLVAVILLEIYGRRSQDAVIDWKARVTGDVEIAPARLSESTQDPLVRWFNHHLQRAGLDVETNVLKRLIIGMLGLGIIIGLMGGALMALVALFVEIVVAYLWFLRREAVRRARILEQLPDFIEYMMRTLSAGNSLEESLYSATAESDEPARSLFLSVSRQVRLGAPIEDVLDEAAEIHRIQDIRVMAMAARVNRRYGGSLKRIFKSLVQAIRERDSAARELRALTAETRFSAIVLAIVPLALSVYILLQNPEYYSEMWNDPKGRKLLFLSVILQTTGILVIWRMLHAAEERG